MHTLRWASCHRLDKVEDTYGTQALMRAVDTCRKIWQFKEEIGLERHELFKIAFFIETKLESRINKGKYYLRKERTGLARTIEYDPKTGRVFIHLKTHKVPAVGEGWHKKVTRSILYDHTKPELVANSVLKLDESSQKEIEIVKLLQDEKGIAKTYAVTEHTKKNSHEKVVSIIQKLYKGHSLYHHQHKPGSLSPHEMVQVARDLCQGLEALHKHDLVHRDMHGGNFLLDREVVDIDTQVFQLYAAIIDFGQTKKARDAAEKGPMVEVPLRFNPPDAFWRTKENIDAKAIDVYALGLNLYHLFFGVQPEWADKEKFADIGHLSRGGKVTFRNELRDTMKHYLNKREEEVKNNYQGPIKKFAELILQMCDPEPGHRGTARELRKELEKILEKLEDSSV